MQDCNLETMDQLEDVFKRAIKKGTGLGVLIDMPGFAEPELITNPPANLEKKLDYYKSAYDINLNHKHAAGIRIMGYSL